MTKKSQATNIIIDTLNEYYDGLLYDNIPKTLREDLARECLNRLQQIGLFPVKIYENEDGFDLDWEDEE